MGGRTRPLAGTIERTTCGMCGRYLMVPLGPSHMPAAKTVTTWPGAGQGRPLVLGCAYSAPLHVGAKAYAARTEDRNQGQGSGPVGRTGDLAGPRRRHAAVGQPSQMSLTVVAKTPRSVR
jgi:hypothetical protein